MKSYCACWEKEGEKIVRKKTLFPVTRGSEEPSIVLDCSQKPMDITYNCLKHTWSLRSCVSGGLEDIHSSVGAHLLDERR